MKLFFTWTVEVGYWAVLEHDPIFRNYYHVPDRKQIS